MLKIQTLAVLLALLVVDMMRSKLHSFCKQRIVEFEQIPEERKNVLKQLSDYINQKRKKGEIVPLIFICTHNSRRSHFAQVWSQIAIDYYKLKNIHSFSGGTEATAMHPNTVKAIEETGILIHKKDNSANPVYELNFSDNRNSIICFSKVFNHSHNPQNNFAAIMTCSEAEENCPFIPNAEIRMAITYSDPKVSDGTNEEEKVYSERCAQIAREMFFTFAQIK